MPGPERVRGDEGLQIVLRGVAGRATCVRQLRHHTCALLRRRLRFARCRDKQKAFEASFPIVEPSSK